LGGALEACLEQFKSAWDNWELVGKIQERDRVYHWSVQVLYKLQNNYSVGLFHYWSHIYSYKKARAIVQHF
jgi:hypothetical protein